MAAQVEKQIKRMQERVDAALAQRTARLAFPYMEHQKPVFKSRARCIVLAKGRRWGGTRGASRWILEGARKGEKCLWVDVGHRQIMRYVKQYFFTALRYFPRGAYSFNERIMQLEFANGGLIDFGSAERPELLEGTAYDRICINEAGIVLRDEALYFHTLLPMGAEGKGAKWAFVGTPKGKGLFYGLYERGLDDQHVDWVSFQRTSYENPLLSRDELEVMRQQMPEVVYQQEVLAEFVSDGGEFFTGIDEAATALYAEDPIPGEQYVIGVDVAKSQDFTVLWVGHTGTSQAHYVERFNRLGWAPLLKKIANASKRFNNARVLIDATGMGGDKVFDDLRSMDVPVEPFIFTAQTKAEVLNLLALDVEQGRLQFWPHEATLREMRAFERHITPAGNWRFAAPSGFHDDCVIALSLCNWAMNHAYGNTTAAWAKPGIGSLLRDPVLN